MLEYIPLSIALLGSSIAGLWDLKTTEIPDWIPNVMVLLGIAFWGVQSYLLNDYWLIAQSLVAGASLFGLGALMYYFGQWGGGDAKILAATGVLVPANIYNMSRTFLPFPASYLINVFLLGAVYMIIYAVVLTLRNREIVVDFLQSVRGKAKTTLAVFAGIFLLMYAVTLLLSSRFGVQQGFVQMSSSSLTVSLLYLSLVMLWRFVLSVEKVGFRRKVPVSKLRVGDVLLDSKYWEGVTKKDVSRIKKSGKRYVVIKDGVRFGPVFPIALAFTLIAGDFILLFFNFI